MSLAQGSHSYINFTTENGLPSNECYALIQDNKGVIWMATDHGVVRYDGYEFKTFTTENGLTHNTILRLKFDDQGKLWCLGIDGTLSLYSSQTQEFVAQSEINKLIQKKLLSDNLKGIEIEAFHIEPNGDLIFSIGVRSKAVWKYKQKTESIEKIDLPKHVGYNVQLYETESNGVFICKAIGQESNNVQIAEKGNSINLSIPIVTGERLKSKKLKNGKYFIASEQNIWIFDKRKLLKKYKLDKIYVKSIYEDQDGIVWLVTREKGIRWFDSHNNQEVFKPFFPKNLKVNWILQEEFGSLWVSSQENGLLRFPKTSILNYSPTAGKKIVKFRRRGNTLVASSSIGELFQFSSSKVEKMFTPKFSSQKSMFVNDFFFPTNNSVAFNSLVRTFNLSSRNMLFKEAIGGICFLKIDDSIALIGTSQGMVRYNYGNRAWTDFDFPKFTERTNALERDQNNDVWVGSISGLYKVEGKGLQKVESYHTAVASRVMDIQSHKNILYIATRGKGIVRKDGDQYMLYGKKNGLLTNMYECVFVQNDSIVWAGSRVGLSRLSLDKNYSVRSISNFNTLNGLPSNEVNDIEMEGGKILIATSKGLASLDLQTASFKSAVPKLQIDQLLVQKKAVDISSDLKFDHNQNNIDITYAGLSYSSGKDVSYRYRLRGLSDDWQMTSERSVSYQHLEPGTYKFELIAANKDNNWTEIPLELSFRIKKHFTQTWLFRILASLLTIFIIWYLVRRYYNNRQMKFEIKSRITELEHLAMSNSMNPHFIFNALHSVQSNMNRGKIVEANEMLIGFSKLIRLNLQNRSQSFVSLNQTIDRLELYLETERIRIGERLKYEIKVDPELALEYIIPSMVVQPFVENAIWHGILPKKGGSIEIRFEKMSDYLVVEIEDDGIGLQQIKNKSSHVSISTQLTKERLKLLGESSGKLYEIDVIDKRLLEKSEAGVLVRLIFPIEIVA